MIIDETTGLPEVPEGCGWSLELRRTGRYPAQKQLTAKAEKESK